MFLPLSCGVALFFFLACPHRTFLAHAALPFRQALGDPVLADRPAGRYNDLTVAWDESQPGQSGVGLRSDDDVLMARGGSPRQIKVAKQRRQVRGDGEQVGKSAIRVSFVSLWATGREQAGMIGSRGGSHGRGRQ